MDLAESEERDDQRGTGTVGGLAPGAPDRPQHVRHRLIAVERIARRRDAGEQPPVLREHPLTARRILVRLEDRARHVGRVRRAGDAGDAAQERQRGQRARCEQLQLREPGVQLAPQRLRPGVRHAAEQHRVGVGGRDGRRDRRVAGRPRVRLRVDPGAVPDDGDSGRRSVARDQVRDHGVVGRIGVVAEHLEPRDPQRTHVPDRGLGLGEIGGHQPRKRLDPVRIEVARVAGEVERVAVGEADVAAAGADLQDVVLVVERQRDRRRGRVEVADVGDRAEIRRGGVRREPGLGGLRGAGYRVGGIVEGGEAHVQLADVAAGVVERQRLAVGDVGSLRGARAEQRQV